MRRRKQRNIFVAYQAGSQSDGGLESSTRIYEVLAEEYDWTFITNHDSAFTARWRESGAKVVLSSFENHSSAATRAAQTAVWSSKIFLSLLQRGRCCVHANDTRAFRAAALPASLLGVPVILTVRDTKPDGASYGRIWKRASIQCQRIVALSDEMGRTIASNLGLANDRLRTINSIVDLDRFRPPLPTERTNQRARLGIGSQDFAIGCIGAVRDKKNQLGLLEQVVPQLMNRLPRSQVHFLGDFTPYEDDYQTRCSAAIERLGLSSHVTFHGHVEDIAERTQALDCIVIGARHEGLARAMIEGMACGVPVVSFSVCSAQEMLGDTGAGYVVRQGDYASLYSALANLADDPAKRAHMGSRGRAKSEQLFNSEKIGADYKRLYDEVGFI